MNAKVMSDEEKEKAKAKGEAKRPIAKVVYKNNLGSDLENSPTAGAIWDLKEKPGWDGDSSRVESSGVVEKSGSWHEGKVVNEENEYYVNKTKLYIYLHII